ncbi:hypothetical protein ACIA5C_44275 [Actinoplanes sp. NPDC051343]|jgi:hypothetical protein|uniref:hypothetical protein n=1 Tax=Actinoplanes sp. NPDC051343 TaxID=3363906 RepID=UPI003795D906
MVAMMLAVLAPLALIALATGAIRMRGGYDRCPTHSRPTAAYCMTARPTADRP